jgi:hypothetical protein
MMRETDDDGIDDFVGFYSAEGFWVGDRVDVLDVENEYRLAGIVPEISVWHDAERFSAAVCVDGLMLLHVRELAATVPAMGDPTQFEAGVRWWGEHINYANAMQICLESESIAHAPKSSEIVSAAVLQAETVRVGFQEGRPVRRVLSMGPSVIATRFEAANWSREKGSPPVEAISTGWTNWNVVPEAVVVSGLAKFERVGSDPVLVTRLSFVAKAKSAYGRNDFTVAFTLLWFVIESAAKDLLAQSVPGKSAAKSGSHQSVLGVVAELKSAGVISDNLFSLLEHCRKLRNRMMHQSESTVCMPSDCRLAADAAVDLAVRDASLGIRTKWLCGVEF